MNGYVTITTNCLVEQFLIIAESLEEAVQIFKKNFPDDNITEIKQMYDYILMENAG